MNAIETFLFCSLILNVMLALINGTVIGMYLKERYWRDVWHHAATWGHASALDLIRDEDEAQP